ncbi:Universal stress protein A-like protein [Apostasia shenzhenica]|uniref:Universal stress protein A-like protein n=1 Tax=Apostasia shenzhenica TaxID=1088818 RepID=A0A2I0AG06_9ASPA|nr:Universal stress protein A-like protein [Apostasia shenzhenica]
MGRRIVLAVDEGEESRHALTWCLENIAAPSPPAESAAAGTDGGAGDTVLLVYARPPRVVYSALDGTGYLFSGDVIASMDKYSIDLANVVISKAMAVCAGYPNVKVETRVRAGDPRDVICEAVEELGADILVIGSHGYGLFKRALLGSVSSHCAQNAKCPVVIVKMPKS